MWHISNMYFEHANVVVVVCASQVQALLLSPVCPHFSEYIWTTLIKMVRPPTLESILFKVFIVMLQPNSIIRAHWPEVGMVDHTLIKEANYLNEVVHEFRVRIKKMMDIRGKVGGTMSTSHSLFK